MQITWLDGTDYATGWAYQPWTDFAEPATRPALAVLPLYGLADHGLGHPLDSEEILGGALLRAALASPATPRSIRVLPPVRGGLAPYPSTFFGVEAETLHAQLHEIARGVRAAGVTRLAFWVTSPWHEAWAEVMARDIRLETGLATYVVRMSGLGVNLHPDAPERELCQALLSHLTGRPAAPVTRAADGRDTTFRPGRWREPTPPPGGGTHDVGAALDRVSTRLATILRTIAAPDAPAQGHQRSRSNVAVTDGATPPLPWPSAWRRRYLGALTRDEWEALPRGGQGLVILPVGAIEQHGPHLPMGVDSLLAQAWLDETLARLPATAPVWVAPPLWYGLSGEHAEFPGTLSLSSLTLRRLVLAAARQVHALGFRRLAVLNTHGGNSPLLVTVLREIQETYDLSAGLLRPGTTAGPGGREAREGFHAGQWETALMLAVAPSTVQMHRALAHYPPVDPSSDLHPVGAPATPAWLTRELSPSGVIGDATLAKAHDGQAWFEAGCADLAARLLALVPEQS
jgi:creatinine amidohydrolase